MKAAHVLAQAKPWNAGGGARGVRRSLLAAPAATVVPGAAAVGIVGKAPATCWDSSNGATVVSATCTGAKTQQWDFTSAGAASGRFSCRVRREPRQLTPRTRTAHAVGEGCKATLLAVLLLNCISCSKAGTCRSQLGLQMQREAVSKCAMVLSHL